MKRSALVLLGSLLASATATHALDSTTVFNEVMYHPAVAGEAEWIELHNEMAINMDLTGWRISGGVNFTMPANTVIPAGGFLVVASDPAALQSATGLTGILGPWIGSLDNGGESVRLRNMIGREMDALDYNDGGSWPEGADGSGMSLSRKPGHTSGQRPEHWQASWQKGGTPGQINFAAMLGPVQPVFGASEPWLFHDTSAGLAGNWAAASYVAGIGGWQSGNGVLAFEEATLPWAVGTVLSSPASHPTGTYYFQKQFAFAGDPATTRVTLNGLLDDGAVVYLNGQEVARLNMPVGTFSASTTALQEVENANPASIVLASGTLQAGTNVLSVEVHQAGKLLVPATGGTGLTLVETGGSLFATNYARQAGVTVFAKDLLGNGAYAPTHTIPNLNNGTYGNPSSWIGNSNNSFCGISFGSTAVNLGSVAFGRDNTGTYFDRCAGTYTLEYTALANPGISTPATGVPATGWVALGTITYPTSSSPYSLRHAYSFPAVQATGIRLTVPGNGLGSGGCIDELEAGPPLPPPTPIFRLMATGGELSTTADLSLTGTAFAKDVIPGYAAHTIPHLNDGIYGNPNSWIGNSANSFCGISFATSRQIGRVAFGRDNTGTYSDRTLGAYTVQFTTVANPSAATPDASWTSIGLLTVDENIPSPSLRHVYEFPPVNATGLRLLVPSGACVDELEFYSPVSPDVVWGASLDTQAILPPPTSLPLRLSETGGSSAAVWKLELENTGSAPLSLGGLMLSTSDGASFSLPSQSLAPGGFLVLDEVTLGFRAAAGSRVFLLTAGGAGLIDSGTVRTTTRARDAQGRFLTPASDTFGAANVFALHDEIVIHEIMYHYPPNSSNGLTPVTENPEEWIELTNKSAVPVDLSGWRLSEGINFTFPPGSSLAAGGYVVVAKDAALLAAKWPARASQILGNFEGTLSNSGERIVLEDASKNVADEVSYGTGGAWPSSPDAGGTSLELRDVRAENAVGGAWTASSEPGGPWQTITYRMTSGQLFGQTLWNEFRLGMLDAGECLVDDVSVVRDPDGIQVQLIEGGNFESLSSKWRSLGNHGGSAVEAEPGNAGNHVLHIRAAGAFAWNHNHVETTYAGNAVLVDGQVYEVSFRAKWLAGSNQLNTRSYYSRLARTTELPMPGEFGTPGAANSTVVANLGPTLQGLSHSPAIPSAAQAVTVSCHAQDPDNVAGLTLRYALNGETTFSSIPMSGSGGAYSAEIPAHGAGTIIQFYVEALDTLGALTYGPAAGPNSHALYIVDDGQGSTLAAHELRLVMLPADSASLLATLNRLSDGRLPGTAIYRRSEVFYDVGVRLQGTAAGRIRDGESYPGYDVAFPADHLFRGVHDSVNIDRSGRGPVVRGQDEIYIKHLFHRSGLPCSYDDLCYLITPNSVHTGTAILQMAGYEKTYVDSAYESEGTVFNLDGTYEPSTNSVAGDVQSLKNPVPLATQLQSDLTDLGNDPEIYRGILEPRSGKRRNDFTQIIALCKAMAAPNGTLAAQTNATMDVDEWLRCAALYSLCGINDCYMNGGFAHNFRIFAPSSGGGAQALPWDMDFLFSFAASSGPILATGNLNRLINLPVNRRRYYGHLYDMCYGAFQAAYLTPWMQHYGSVVGQNMSGQSAYVTARRAAILSALPAPVTFAISTNGGADFTTSTLTAVLEGTGWIDVDAIQRTDTGLLASVEWLTESTWRLTIALSPGVNSLALDARNMQGVTVGTDAITITSTAVAPTPVEFLRITELHYHPADPAGAELAASGDADDFEFIELRNFGPTILDISGCSFADGVDFLVPNGVTLAAGEYVFCVRNQAAFQGRYGTGHRILGAYGPADALSNSGELVALLDARGEVIQSFTYGDGAFWPTAADGGGYSLVLIEPQLPLDRNLPAAWRQSQALGGNPGGQDAQLWSGVASSDLDQDGLSALMEYALGSSEAIPGDGLAHWSFTTDAGGITFHLQRSLTADAAACVAEVSSDLNAWSSAGLEMLSSEVIGGVVHETWHLASGPQRVFWRITATLR